MSQQTVPDLSPEGVDRILAALANAGLSTYYNETDGDTALEVWLVDLEATPVRVLSWRDTSGWRLCEWDGEAHDDPDRTWPIKSADLTELAAEVARLVDETEAPDHDPDGYWVQLAVALHSAADRVLTLAGTDRTPVDVELDITGAWPQNTDPTETELVDVIASAFDLRAAGSKLSSGRLVYKARKHLGPLDVSISTYVPDREGRECVGCGATTGLVMLPYGPLDPIQWACADAQCPAAGRAR